MNDKPHAFSLFVRRPIMTWGVTLLALVVLAIIMLAPQLADAFGIYSFSQTYNNISFAEAAITLILFCTPTIIGAVFVIMRNLLLPRPLRIVLAILACGGAVILFSLALFTCGCPVQSPEGVFLRSILRFVNRSLWPVVVILGVCLGISLPISTRAQEHKTHHTYPKRVSTLVLLAFLTWMFGVFSVTFAMLGVVFPSFSTNISMAVLVRLEQAVVNPCWAFCICAVLTGVIWSATNVSLGFLQKLFFYIPLALLGVMLGIGILDYFVLHIATATTYVLMASSGAFVLVSCILGICFGIGVGRMPR